QLRRGEDTTDEQSALRLGDRRPRAGDPLEEIVEGADLTGEQRRTAREQRTLGAIDVRPVRHDQVRIAVEDGQIAVEQKLDFARVCRPSYEAERHLPIVERGADDPRWPLRACPQR